MIHKLDDSNIDYWLTADKAHIILFYSESTPNSPAVKKVFEEFNTQFKDKVDVLMCEYDKVEKTKDIYQMNTLPGFLFMKSGKCYGNLVGPASKMRYQEIVKDGMVQIMNEKS
jgi:hypothetical protein